MTNEEIRALLERVLKWPHAMQEQAAEALLGIEAAGVEPCVLSQEERRGVKRGLEDVRHGRFATDEEMAALFARYRR